jgi:hypothetical protein
MLQVSRLAPKLLGDATDRVEEFFREQIHEDGGGRDRSGRSDLYYTVFVAEGLLALQRPLQEDPLRGFLDGFGDGDGLDLVHLACLARCWACLPKGALPARRAEAISHRIERYRSKDLGFAPAPGAEIGTVYHGFLAFAAHQDLGQELRHPAALRASVEGLRTSDGAFANLPGQPVGTTTVTAAAVALLRSLDAPAPDDVGPWLLARAQPDGGFSASPLAPIPDLLSTATALHALAGLHVDCSAIQPAGLDFLDTLWTGRAFCGHWADDVQDAEYTWYALLALGHLSLQDAPRRGDV